MKVFQFLLFAFGLAIAMAACNKDKDANLAGTWAISDISYAGTGTSTSGGTTLNITMSGEGSDYNADISFSESPEQYTATGNYDITLTTTVPGLPAPIVSQQTNVNLFGTGAWALSGNQVTLTPTGGSPGTASVVFSNGNRTAMLTQALTQTYTENGAVIVQNVTYYITLTR